MVTIFHIVDDLMNIIRGSNISQSEPISKYQVIDMVNYYRALYAKRELDKKSTNISQSFIQNIPSLELTEHNYSATNDVYTDYYTMSTVADIPELVNSKSGNAVTYVGTIDGREIQLVSKQRSKYQKYIKYAQNEPLVYLESNKVRVVNDTLFKYITLDGVFDNPLDVMVLNNEDSTTTEYPVPASLIPQIKSDVLRELGVMAQAPTDDANDSDHNVTPETRQV